MFQLEFQQHQEVSELAQEKVQQEIRFQAELHQMRLKCLSEEHEWKKQEHEARLKKLL